MRKGRGGGRENRIRRETRSTVEGVVVALDASRWLGGPQVGHITCQKIHCLAGGQDLFFALYFFFPFSFSPSMLLF